MLCKDIIEKIEERFPPSCAMEWDNVGLLVGRDDKEVRNIYVAVDATDEVLREAKAFGADMLITHHPMIFSGMKRINNHDFIGNRVLELIRSDISYYAMHTNYDIKGMAELSFEKMQITAGAPLEVTGVGCDGKEEGIGRIAALDESISLKECCKLVKQAFGLNEVRVFGDLDHEIRTIAICPGSGKSVIGCALQKNADVLITGDIGHHEGIDAWAQNMAVIDAGHYGIEHIFTEDVGAYLRKELDGVTIKEAPVNHPFQTV